MVGYIAGLTAPKGRRMGHAGAIISAFGESAAEKVEILQECGVTVAPSPADLGTTMAQVLKKLGWIVPSTSYRSTSTSPGVRETDGASPEGTGNLERYLEFQLCLARLRHSKPRVIVTRRWPQEVEAAAPVAFDVQLNPSDSP